MKSFWSLWNRALCCHIASEQPRAACLRQHTQKRRACSSRTELTGTLFFSHPRITPSDVTWNFCWITRDQRHIREYKSLHCHRPIVIIIVMITLRVPRWCWACGPQYTLCAAGAAADSPRSFPPWVVANVFNYSCVRLDSASNRQAGNWVPKSIPLYNPILTGSKKIANIYSQRLITLIILVKFKNIYKINAEFWLSLPTTAIYEFPWIHSKFNNYEFNFYSKK